MDSHGRWRSDAFGLQAECGSGGASLRESSAASAPQGAGRERPGKAGSAAPSNFVWREASGSAG